MTVIVNFSVVIKVGQRTLELTHQEAREVLSELTKTLGPQQPSFPLHPPGVPVYREVDPFFNPNRVTCDAKGQ